ncbi:MAG: hypothetical protein ACLQED_09140 [Desulfobaccales bacterium]
MKKIARILVLGTVLALGSIPVGHAYAWSEHESAALQRLVEADRAARKNEELSLYGYPPRYPLPASTSIVPITDDPWWAQLLVFIGVAAFCAKLVKVHAAKEDRTSGVDGDSSGSKMMI